MRSFTIVCAALLVGLPAASAQTPRLCEHQNENSYCEIRELNLPFSGAVDVRTGGVGAITVKAWDNAYVLARVHVNASAGDEWQARTIAAAVQIDTTWDRIWASGPNGKSSAVSYDVFVPRDCGLRLYTKVGAISLANVAGTIDVETSVGALSLWGLAATSRPRPASARFPSSWPAIAGRARVSPPRPGPAPLKLPPPPTTRRA